MGKINLFDFKKLNNKNVWIEFDNSKDLQKFLDWNKLLNLSFNYSDASEYFRVYDYKENKESLLFNFKEHCVSFKANIKNKKAIIYSIDDVLLKDKEDINVEIKRMKKEKAKLIKYNKELFLEISDDLANGISIHEYIETLKYKDFKGNDKYRLLNYNIDDIENYNILLGLSKEKGE